MRLPQSFVVMRKIYAVFVEFQQNFTFVVEYANNRILGWRGVFVGVIQFFRKDIVYHAPIEYNAIPIAADIRIRIIGEIFFFLKCLYTQ